MNPTNTTGKLSGRVAVVTGGARGTTTAFTASPQRASGTPITQAS